MISYFSDSSAISEILQLSTSLLGTAISIAAIIYTLFLAFATNEAENGTMLIKGFELRRLIMWILLASVFEMLSVVITLIWSYVVRVSIVINYNALASLGIVSVTLLLFGLILIFIGLMGIVKQLKFR